MYLQGFRLLKPLYVYTISNSKLNIIIKLISRCKADNFMANHGQLLKEKQQRKLTMEKHESVRKKYGDCIGLGREGKSCLTYLPVM